MPKKPPRRLPSDLPREKVIRALGRLGVHLIREGGRHSYYGDPANAARRASVPRHSRIKRNIVRDILDGLGIKEEEFMRHY